MRFKKLIFFFIIYFLHFSLYASPYSVQFLGINNKETIELLKSTSKLINQKDKPAQTEILLHKRAESDIVNFENALQSLSYYNPKINFNIDFSKDPINITFNIDPGMRFLYGKISILPSSLNIDPTEIGLDLEKIAYPKIINESEEALLQLMQKRGYPLARIEKKEIVADDKKSEIYLTFSVEPGPLLFFGETYILGLKTIDECYLRKKIAWKTGKIYNPCKVEKTIENLEETGLFSSVNIVHSDEPTNGNSLPITVYVKEGKHRSVGAGVGFSTQLGPGVTFEWEHRNFREQGQKFRFDTNLLLKKQEASMLYTIRDFHKKGVDLLLLSELTHENTEGFEATTMSLSAIFEKKIGKCSSLSYGMTFEQLQIADSDNDGSYSLIKSPFLYRFSNTDDLLDPTCGYNILFKTVPAYQLIDEQFFYSINTLTAAYYFPFNSTKKFVMAIRAQFGSILGASRKTIPASDRFYAGSETTLRGYNYYTVSPLDKDNDPIGGRSLIIYTIEARMRFTQKIGAALFYDIGNVYSSPLPSFDKKMLESVGVGLRYYTIAGPLRLDFSFPLNKRSGLDNSFQFYFSIGQSF